MGLDTTHDCWHGPYSSFNRWRTAVAQAVGISLRQMKGFGGAIAWDSLPPDPLHVLLAHSDCDGEIKWQDCGPLADRLQEILPSLSDDVREDAETFIAGLRSAAAARENVEFH